MARKEGKTNPRGEKSGRAFRKLLMDDSWIWVLPSYTWAQSVTLGRAVNLHFSPHTCHFKKTL